MLSTEIQSTAEIISIALAAEREAMSRYAVLAAKMHERGNSEVGRLFERMVDEEQAHEKQLIEWAELEGISTEVDVGPVSWEDPAGSSIYADEARDPALCTPYKALAVAVHNEERAFRYYSYVAAHSTNENVKRIAEVLANEELGHSSLLRTWRRRAWHAERDQEGAEPRLDPGLIHDVPDVLAATVCIERILVNQMDAGVQELPALIPLAAKTHEDLSMSETALQESGSPGPDVVQALQSIAEWHKEMYAETDDTVTIMRKLCVDCDRSFAFYDSVVDSAESDELMLMAQDLTSRSLDRIAELQDAIGSICDHSD